MTGKSTRFLFMSRSVRPNFKAAVQSRGVDFRQIQTAMRLKTVNSRIHLLFKDHFELVYISIYQNLRLL